MEIITLATCSKGRHFRESTKRVMWARSAGVCQFPGCAEILYLDQNVPKASITIAELAHIIGFSIDGPRGDEYASDAYADDPDNLLFLCRNCHKKIDSSPTTYTVELLRRWKTMHENQVLQAAQLTAGRELVPLILRSTHIGGRPNLITNEEVLKALVDEGFSAAVAPKTIQFENEAVPSTDQSYWQAQIQHGRMQLRSIRKGLEPEHVNTPLAIFPRAEMPILMAFGHMIGNSSRVHTFHPDAQRQTWSFRNDGYKPLFNFDIGNSKSNDYALTLELTAPLESARIKPALPNDLPIARLSADQPSRDLVASAEVIEDFRIAAQSALSELEQRMPRNGVVHVFPAMAPSLAFAFGSILQPKASNTFRIYDGRGPGGAFTFSLDLPIKDSEAR